MVRVSMPARKTAQEHDVTHDGVGSSRLRAASSVGHIREERRGSPLAGSLAGLGDGNALEGLINLCVGEQVSRSTRVGGVALGADSLGGRGSSGSSWVRTGQARESVSFHVNCGGFCSVGESRGR